MKNFIRSITAFSAFVIPFFSALTSVTPVSAQEPVCRSVRVALEAGEITLTLEANESAFYNEPLDYSVQNISNGRVEFCFPVGMMMVPGSGSYQDLLLTKTVNVILAPGEQKEGRLSAACANLSKSAPASGTSFQLGPMAEGDMLRVAQAIEHNGAQGRLGAQLALWAVTDGLTLDDIGGESGSEDAEMFRLIAPLLCLTREELTLGQQLLVEANTKARLFQGDAESSLAFCEELGIPTDLNQLMLVIGQYSLIALCCCGGGCGLFLAMLVGGIVLIVRSRKR